MTDARLDPVFEDRVRAREFLAQARQFLIDADSDISAQSASILLHNAAVAACDAILQAAGLRVTSGNGAHVLRLKAALARLPEHTDELFDALDAARDRRNEASYHAGLVAQASLDDAREATTLVVALAESYLAD